MPKAVSAALLAAGAIRAAVFACLAASVGLRPRELRWWAASAVIVGRAKAACVAVRVRRLLFRLCAHQRSCVLFVVAFVVVLLVVGTRAGDYEKLPSGFDDMPPPPRVGSATATRPWTSVNPRRSWNARVRCKFFS